MSVQTFLLVFIGGGFGSLCRYAISVLLKVNSDFPWPTLLANVLSCLILGLLVYEYKTEIDHSNFLKPLLIIGFCGGFSTFSTFSIEAFNLMKNEQVALALLYVLISLISCLLLFFGISRIFTN
jgi:CrcB protein